MPEHGFSQRQNRKACPDKEIPSGPAAPDRVVSRPSKIAGSSALFDQFERMAALPPYVLAAVDELKSRLRSEGKDVRYFGLGNPDGASPKAAIDRLVTEAQRPANHRYMPSRGLPEVRKAICDWYGRHYGVSFDPETESV